jgi:hypothetical protein
VIRPGRSYAMGDARGRSDALLLRLPVTQSIALSADASPASNAVAVSSAETQRCRQLRDCKRSSYWNEADLASPEIFVIMKLRLS